MVLAGLALRLVQTAVTTRGDAATSDSLSGVVLAGLAPELVQIFADAAQSTTDVKRVAVVSPQPAAEASQSPEHKV